MWEGAKPSAASVEHPGLISRARSSAAVLHIGLSTETRQCSSRLPPLHFQYLKIIGLMQPENTFPRVGGW